MKAALIRLLESSKTWTVVLGLTATFLARFGIHTDDQTAQMIAAGFLALLGAQAVTDHGKAAALINQQTAMLAMRGGSNERSVPSKDPELAKHIAQGGFAKLGLMMFVAMAGVLSIAADGCHPTPAPIQDIINCTLQDQGKINQLEAQCAALIPDWGKVEQCAIAALPAVGYEIGSCVIADIIQQYLVKKGATVPVADTWTAKGMLEDWRTKYGKNATIKTKDGSL
jgi:hypothetical protein